MDAWECRVRFECGKLNTSYPFYDNEMWSKCGHRAFKVVCEGNTTTMMINDIKYRVIEINQKGQMMRISRVLELEYSGEVCPMMLNTTFNPKIFSHVGPFQEVTLVYDCRQSINICLVSGVIYEDDFIQVYDTKYLSSASCKRNVTLPVPISFLPAAKANWSEWKLILNHGFQLKWEIPGVACGDCLDSKGYCAFEPFGNETVCYCRNLRKYYEGYNHSCFDVPLTLEQNPQAAPGQAPQAQPESSVMKNWKRLIGIIVGVVGMIIILSTILLIKCLRRNKTVADQNVEVLLRGIGSFAPTRYSYSDVKKITRSFSSKLGQGGFGEVYKGQLLDGRPVAVKVLRGSKGDGEEFTNEVASISRTSHVNVVNLLGFCYERNKKALIYEFMPNGSLDKFICNHEASTLALKTLYQIAVGVARGLEYLHRGCNTKIVHFDIKPHNILLDEDFCPKISDFGLAKPCKKMESIVSMWSMRGTAGYIAPEVWSRKYGVVSSKSDVYSYGMLLFEMVRIRKNIDVRDSNTSEIYFSRQFYQQVHSGYDFEFHGVLTEEEKVLTKKMTVVSLWCIQTLPSDRPTMTKVVEMLEGDLESLQVPPKPSLASGRRSCQHFSPPSSSSSLIAGAQHYSEYESVDALPS